MNNNKFHLLTHIILLCLNVCFTIFAYPLTYLLEKAFKISSALSYLELLDTGHPLLHRLSMTAPGTFKHSVQVANIAKQAVTEIEGNGLLTYVGALYHDIGKIKHKEYFIENFVENQNPHLNISPLESAKIIIGHVAEGLALAQKYKLPKEVTEFIETHHGTTRIEYFYKRSQAQESPDEEHLFRYKGPRPSSKETAVVMIADSIEAACRSLKQVNVAEINNLVQRIIDEKIQSQQLENSNLTFRDIAIIRRSILQQMVSIYHTRING